MIRRAVQYLLFPFAVVTGGEWQAKPGTLKFRFLNWLYGDPDEVSDGWIYPQE